MLTINDELVTITSRAGRLNLQAPEAVCLSRKLSLRVIPVVEISRQRDLFRFVIMIDETKFTKTDARRPKALLLQFMLLALSHQDGAASVQRSIALPED